MCFDRAGEEHLIMTCAATDAVDEVINLVHQCAYQRMHFSWEMVDELAQRGVGALGDREGEEAHSLFAVFADAVRTADLLFQRAGEGEDGVGVATEKVGLLIFEKTEQGAVFLQFVTQAFSDKFPGSAHSYGVDEVEGLKRDLDERGAATEAGENCFSSILPRPMPPLFARLSARTSVIM
jgi:hypothetical protein